MPTKTSSAGTITVYTNGNKYDSKRFIFNPKYVRTFDAFLDQITTQTNATCAVRKIYTPHGSRQVESLSSIKPGGQYVAVSRGNFKKIQYGRKIDTSLSSEGTTTTKTPKSHKIASRIHRAYEDEIKARKKIYVYRNGFHESPTQIFFTKRLLRSFGQVLDVVQEKLTSERAIVSLHKLDGVTIEDVNKLQGEGRYVAVEQGQKFRHCTYDHLDSTTEETFPRRAKLPAIRRQRGHQGQKAQHLSNSSSEKSNTKPKIKLPVLKQKYDNPGFHIVHGYPDKFVVHTTGSQLLVQPHEEAEARKNTRVSHAGAFYASGAQMEIGNAIREDKRVRVEKPLDLLNAEVVEEQLDNVNQQGNDQRTQLESRVKPITRHKEIVVRAFKNEKRSKKGITLPQITKVPHSPGKYTSFPTKPNIAHPRRHAQKQPRVVKDQQFVSNENAIATIKRYNVTREQHLFSLHGRDSREHAQNVVDLYERGIRVKGLEREKHEVEKRKRIEDWVDQTVEVKQRHDEIAFVAKQLVTSALANAEKSIVTEMGRTNFKSATQNKPNFYEASNQNEVKYHRVFGQ